jgi:hypothetical protein
MSSLEDSDDFDILACLEESQKQVEVKVSEKKLINTDGLLLPESSYYKYANGVDESAGWFIGNEGFASSLKLIGVADDIISDCLLEPIESRDLWLDYFNNVGAR